MSFTPPFSNTSYSFPPFNSNSSVGNISNPPQTNNDALQRSIRNNFPNCNYVNSPTVNRYHLSTLNPLTTTVNRNENNRVPSNAPLSRLPINAPHLPRPNLINTRPPNFVNYVSQPSDVNPSFHGFHEKSFNRSTVAPAVANTNSANYNYEPRNIPIQRFPPPISNVGCNVLPTNIEYTRFQNNPRINNPEFMPMRLPNPAQIPVSVNENATNVFNLPASSTGIIPVRLPNPPQIPVSMNEKATNVFNSPVGSTGIIPVRLPNPPQIPVSMNENATNVFNSLMSYSTGNASNSVAQPFIYTSPLTVISSIKNSSQDSLTNLQNNSAAQVPQQFPLSDASKPQIFNFSPNSQLLDKETKVAEFLAKFSCKKREKKFQITIPEFRYVIKAVVRKITLLKERKSKLSKLLDANESEWKSEIKNALNEQEELSTLCSFISAPEHLNNIVEKIKLIKKKRERKKKTKKNKLSEKMRAEQKRKERDQEIDKWLDDIKEKNQKIKREAELKKEADYILLEVRRKIHEGKKTIEKIKVFEKLRNARQANATQKGLHVLSIHNQKFEKKMSILKETMMKQLADYEAEEKALKVMLETEQEGQREEEVQWKIKKIKTLQQKKQNHIIECLFGISDDPLPTDPLYLFHKYHTSANSSIENMVQIRQQWDIHIAEEGEVIPQHWVVPVAPNNASWEQCVVTSNN